MTKDQESLSRLTLRQLRQRASDLSIPLYSRKTKVSLVKEIVLYQEKKDSEKRLFSSPINNGKYVGSNGSANQTKVVFLPRDPEWAYVFWEISEADRKKASSQGATRLSLRLVDVTGSNDGTPNPGTLREVIVDSHSTEWYLPIPLGDRDYQVELGYRFKAQWISLAFSSSGRVPAFHPSEVILDQFVPFSLETPISYPDEVTIEQDEVRDSGLHERLYQSAITNFGKTRRGSEEFQQDVFSKKGLQSINDSGAGLWASGRNQSGIGVLQNESSFWLVADAELIIYGSTDPSAKLTIGGESVPLASDGTFRLQVPFRDGSQNYLIEAIDSDGIQKRNITMRFERSTPEDNTNPKGQTSEWF